MSACGVTEMQQTSCGTFYGDLEEYLSEVEKRAQRTATETDDVYSQLVQREKDLVLAAELGKALLEKNEEISRANERLAEEYSHKLEIYESVGYICHGILTYPKTSEEFMKHYVHEKLTTP